MNHCRPNISWLNKVPFSTRELGSCWACRFLVVCPIFVTVGDTGVVIEWTSTGLYTCIYTQRSASSLCYCLCALTEIGSPMLSRVNNDVTGGLTTGHWSTLMGHHY